MMYFYKIAFRSKKNWDSLDLVDPGGLPKKVVEERFFCLKVSQNRNLKKCINTINDYR